MKTSEFLKPERKKDESYEAYRIRRCAGNEYVDSPARFRLWPSSQLGTYRKQK